MATPLLPTSLYEPAAGARKRVARRLPRSVWRVVAFALVVLVLFNLAHVNTLRRDLGYIFRPLWDHPEPPFDQIAHYTAPPDAGAAASTWCARHGWTPRTGGRPVVVDAVPISTELDMFEIRMREYAPFVSIFVVVEADAMFSGAPKPLHFAANRQRFDTLAAELGVELVYHQVSGFKTVPQGSFDNEITQRRAIAGVLNDLVAQGRVPGGSLVLESDVDEVVSRETLDLLTTCTGFPQQLHLNMRNYLYSFDQPLRDEGYWRPHVYTTHTGHDIAYSHGRVSESLLMDAGWHCSFCFPTLEDMRSKMRGYSHNDRLSSTHLLDEAPLRRRVCLGQDPFGMWPEAFSFRDIFTRSGGIRRESSFVDVPHALQQHPERWSYLLVHGCERPDE